MELSESSPEPSLPTPLSSPPAHSRPPFITMFSGACTFIFCSCPAGKYETEGGVVGNMICTVCLHPMANHHSQQQQVHQNLFTIPLHWCKRRQVVHNILDRMFRYRVLLIRGTPASGKTSLLNLIHREIKVKLPTWTINTASSWPQELANNESRSKSHLEQLLGIPQESFLAAQQHVLLLDEAQTTYSNTYFWNMFLKSIDSATGPHVVLFSSYGSPTSQPVTYDDLTLTPPVLSPDQRIGLRWTGVAESKTVGLLLTKDEGIEVACSWLAIRPDKPTFSPELITWLHDVCGGHVGSLLGLVEIIVTKDDFRTQVKTGTEITLLAIIPVLFQQISGNLLCRQLQGTAFGRGLPRAADLRDVYTAWVLKTLAVKGKLTDDDVDNLEVAEKTHYRAALHKSFTKGWIHKDLLETPECSEDLTVYVFPSPIHTWYSKAILAQQSPDPQSLRETFRNPLELALAIISRFKPSQLSTPPRSSSQSPLSTTPPKSQYGMEFYRCSHNLLHGNILPSPEFGTPSSGRGVIDFFISGLGWGFELTREGDRIIPHWNRFTPSGVYYPWITGGMLKDWLLIDFRTTRPRDPHPEMLKLYHVVFENGFSHATVLNHMLEKQKKYNLLEFIGTHEEGF